MKTIEISALAVAVMLDNLEGVYRYALKVAQEGRATPAAQMLMAAYEEAESALKAAQEAEG